MRPAGGDTAPVAISPLSIATAPHCLDSAFASQRRNNKGPMDKGGWNLFITVATALDASTPLTNPYLATPCPNDVAGFPCDEELQRLRRSWWESTDEAERARLADQIQVRAYEVVPYINGGQWKQFTAVQTNVSGLGETTVPVFWEVAKEGVSIAWIAVALDLQQSSLRSRPGGAAA